MKKLNFGMMSMAALAMTLGSCQLNEPDTVQRGEVDFSLTAGIPSGLTTYVGEAAFSHQGGANNVDPDLYDLRFIMEIYDGEDMVYRDVKYLADNFASGSVDFSARLLAKKYSVALWADFVEQPASGGSYTDLYYNAGDLRNVQYTAKVTANRDGENPLASDAIDAYSYYNDNFDLTSASASLKATLVRPFGKIRLLAKDELEGVNQSERPVKASVGFASGTTVPNRYNVTTGEASGEMALTGFTFDAKEETALVGESNIESYLLGNAYIFASPSRTNYSMDVKVYGDAAMSSQIGHRQVPNIPVQANKLTTVIGNFYTNEGNLEVIVDDLFEEPENQVPVVEEITVGTLAAAQDKLDELAAGSADVDKYTLTVAERPADSDNNKQIDIPASLSSDVDLIFKQGIPAGGLTVTSSGNAGSTYAKNVVLANNNNSEVSDITVELPDATFRLVNGNYRNADVTTSENTFILGVDAVVENLEVKKGNVKLYGVIETSFKNSGAGKVYRCLSNDKSLQNLLNDNISGYTEILIEEEADIDGSRLSETKPVLNKPVRIMSDAVVAGLDVHVAFSASPVTVEDGAHNVVLKGMRLSTTSEYSLLKITGDHADVKAENCEMILTQGKSNQSGVNIQNGGTGNILDVVLDGCYIGFYGYQDRVNQTMMEDYDYPSDFKWSSYSRGITVGNNSKKTYDGTARTDLHIKNTYIEGAYYSINSLHDIELNVDVENSVFDGRAGLNIWSTSEKHSDFNVKNSKFIGRNGFSGPTESFATIVINNQNNNDGGRWVKNVNIVIDGCDIVSDNDPQTETNTQYMVSNRTKYPCVVEFRNATKLREIKNPRLDYFVELEYWNSIVKDDGTTELIGKDGVELLRTNVWTGEYIKSPVPACDGKVYVGTPEILAGMVYLGFEGDAVLVRDLDLNGKPWPVADDNKAVRGTFDGKGYKVMNLFCETYEEEGQYACDNKTQNAGLFGVFSGTLSNLTLDGAKVYGSRSGCLIGRFDGGTIKNCNVINSEILGGFQKLGILIGYLSSYSETLVEECTVADSYVHREDRQEGANSTQCGGFVGYLQPLGQNVSLRNNVLQNVIVESGKQWDKEDQSASHCFVGNVINSYGVKTDARIELTGNRIIDCILDAEKHPNATDYFGFYLKNALDGEYLNPIIIDGMVIVQ